MKKLLALLLTVALAFSMAVSIKADDEPWPPDARLCPDLRQILLNANDDELISVWMIASSHPNGFEARIALIRSVVGEERSLYHLRPVTFLDLVPVCGSNLDYRSFIFLEATKHELIELSPKYNSSALLIFPFWSVDAFHKLIADAHTNCDCAMCNNCNCFSCVYTRGYAVADPPTRTVLTLDHSLGLAPYTIADALEILKYIVGMDNVIEECAVAFDAALIVSEEKPGVSDALEILKEIVGMPNKISG